MRYVFFGLYILLFQVVHAQKFASNVHLAIEAVYLSDVIQNTNSKEKLSKFGFHVGVNLNHFIRFALVYDKFNLKVNDKKILPTQLAGMQIEAVTEPWQKFSCSIANTWQLSNFRRLKEFPHIEKSQKSLFVNLKGYIFYCLPIENLQIYFGFQFGSQIVPSMFKSSSQYMWMNHPYLGIRWVFPKDAGE